MSPARRLALAALIVTTTAVSCGRIIGRPVGPFRPAHLPITTTTTTKETTP